MASSLQLVRRGGTHHSTVINRATLIFIFTMGIKQLAKQTIPLQNKKFHVRLKI